MEEQIYNRQTGITETMIRENESEITLKKWRMDIDKVVVNIKNSLLFATDKEKRANLKVALNMQEYLLRLIDGRIDIVRLEVTVKPWWKR